MKDFIKTGTLSLFILTTFTSIHAQSSKELWNELEVAMQKKSFEQQDLQAFQADLNDDNSFVEQSISTGLAGVKKEETHSIKNREKQSSFKSPREAKPHANQTIFLKNSFKAPRQRSR